jgi:hypothetical protein
MTTGTKTMTTDRAAAPGLHRRLLVPFTVTAASVALLLFTVGGAEKPATSTPPSTAVSEPPISGTQQVVAGQPRVSELNTAVQRVLADAGASRLVPTAELRRLPDSVVVVLRAEQTALTVGK